MLKASKERGWQWAERLPSELAGENLWLAGWVGLGLVGWLLACLVGWVGLGWVGLGWVGLAGWLVGWLTGWLAGRLAGDVWSWILRIQPRAQRSGQEQI